MSRQGTSGVSCRSRHSRRFRAPTPGGSSFWTRPGPPRPGQGRVAAVVADEVAELEVEEAVVVEVVDQVLGQGPDDRVAFEEAELVGQVVVERLGPRRHVLHRVVLAVGLLAEGGPAQAVGLAVGVGPVVGLVELRGRRLLGAVAAAASASASASAGVDDSRRSTRIGFSISSWSIRSCSAISGSCRISIDWIMRGAIRSRMSIR